MRNDGPVTADDWLTIGPAAALLGVSPSTLRRHLQDDAKRSRSFPAEGEDWQLQRLTGRYQVSRRAVQRLLDSGGLSG